MSTTQAKEMHPSDSASDLSGLKLANSRFYQQEKTFAPLYFITNIGSTCFTSDFNKYFSVESHVSVRQSKGKICISVNTRRVSLITQKIILFSFQKTKTLKIKRSHLAFQMKLPEY